MMGRGLSLSALLFFMLSLFMANGLAADKLKFGTPVKVSANYALPPLAAQDKGFWKENGLEAEWVPFKGGGELHRAFAAGAVDVAMTGAGSATQAIANKVPEILVAETGSRVRFVIWVRADGPLKEPKDLKGATIASGRMGELTNAYGRVLARALGLEKDIKLVAGGGITEELAAIKAGKIDGRVGDLLSGLPLKVKGEIRELVAVDDFLPSPWVDQVVTAHTGVLKRNPDLIKRAVKALRQSALFAIKNRDWALEKLRSELGFSQEAANEAYGSFTYGEDWRIKKEALDNVRSFLVRYGIISEEKAPAVSELYIAGIID